MTGKCGYATATQSRRENFVWLTRFVRLAALLVTELDVVDLASAVDLYEKLRSLRIAKFA